ncbi:cystathionine beta-synthase, partial [Pyrenophora tritici-repentis]
AYKPAEVCKLWEVLESDMLFPLLVRVAPPIVLEAIVHLCKLFMALEGLTASVPEAL